MHPTNCPHCNINWYQSNSIYKYFLSQGYSPEQARESASLFGDTPEHPKHFGANIVGIELSGVYDGISQWKCTNCNTIFDRWTMQPIKDHHD